MTQIAVSYKPAGNVYRLDGAGFARAVVLVKA
jgi:hypothetical protein